MSAGVLTSGTCSQVVVAKVWSLRSWKTLVNSRATRSTCCLLGPVGLARLLGLLLRAHDRDSVTSPAIRRRVRSHSSAPCKDAQSLMETDATQRQRHAAPSSGDEDHRRARRQPGGRLQPDLAAARRRLRAWRPVPAPGHRARPRLRRRPQLPPARPAGDGRRRHRRRGAGGAGARDRRRRHARAAVRRRRVRRRCSRSSRSSTCPTPSACSPRSPACSSPAAPPSSSPRTGSPSAAPTRSSIPYHYVEFDRRRAARALRAAVRARSRSWACSAPAATWSSSTRSGRRSTAPWPATRCACGGSSR